MIGSDAPIITTLFEYVPQIFEYEEWTEDFKHKKTDAWFIHATLIVLQHGGSYEWRLFSVIAK